MYHFLPIVNDAAMVHYPPPCPTLLCGTWSIPLLSWHTSRWGVQWLPALKLTTLQNLCSTAASLGMLNRTRHLCTTRKKLHTQCLSHVALTNCQHWVPCQIRQFPLLLLMSLIFSWTTLMWLSDAQINCSVTPGCHLMSLHPQEAKGLKFRDQGIVQLQLLDNFP